MDIFDGLKYMIGGVIRENIGGIIWWIIGGLALLMVLGGGLVVLLVLLGKKRRANAANAAKVKPENSFSIENRENKEVNQTRRETPMREQPVRKASIERDMPYGNYGNEGGTVRMGEESGTQRMEEIKSVNIRIEEIRNGEYCNEHNVDIECNGEIVLGRSDTADLCINDKTVSGRHLSVSYDGIDVYIVDLGSTNGTKLNGETLEPNDSKKVIGGDTVVIGKTTLKLRISEKIYFV